MSTPANPLIPGDDQSAQQLVDQYTQQEIQRQNGALQANIAAAAEKDPNVTADAQRLGLQVGVGADIAGRNMDLVRKMSLVQNVGSQNLPQSSPRLAKLLEDPTFSGVAYDDLGNLTSIEQGAAKARSNRVMTEAGSVAGNINRSFFGAFKPLIDAVGGGIEDVLASPKPLMDAVTGLDPNLEELKNVWLNPRRIMTQQATSAALDYVSQGIQPGPQQFVTDPNTGGMVKNPDYKWYGRPLVNSLEQVPGALAAFALTGKVGGLAGEAAGAEGAAVEGQTVPAILGTQAAQDTYAQARAKGADQKSAVAAALAAGMTNYGLMGKLPGAVAAETVPGAVGQWAGRSVGMGAAMTAADNAIARNYDPDRGTWEGLPQSIATMAAFEGVGALGHIADAVEASKLRKRSPEAFQQFATAAAEGAESVRVPAHDFVNYFTDKKLDPAAMANDLGVTNLGEAIAAGSDLEIPMGNWIGKLDPEHQKGLLPDVVDPKTEMTARQAEAGKQELQDWVAGGGAEKLAAEYAQADAETQATPEWQQVYSDLKQRYADAGETEARADSLATLHANAYANLARKAGLKPDELLALHNPKVMEGEAPGASALNQSVYHGSPYEFDRFDLGSVGSGEGAQAYGWGLYFAGDKAIANEYRRRLSRRVLLDGEQYGSGELDGSETMMANMFQNRKVAGLSDEVARKQTAEWAKQHSQIKDRYTPKEIGKFLRRLSMGDGQLYEADIPEDHQMLHWDESFGNQPDGVKESLHQLANQYSESDAPWENQLADGLRNLVENNAPGQDFYNWLATGGGQSAGWAHAQEASESLNGAGIAGVKYRDANSRGAGGNSHNYVVFDDSAINLIKTFYQGEVDPKKARNLEAARVQGEMLTGQPRGWFRMRPDGSYEIGKTKIGDFSTFVHEPAHAYLEMFRTLTQREGASEPLKDDFKKIAEWLGTTPEEAYKNGFTREQHERWARANEEYVREGKAPTTGLRRAFQNFAVWMSSIYRRASALGVELSPEIRGVMDRLYAGEDAVNRAEQEAPQRLVENPEEMGWTEEEFNNYAQAKGLEVDAAKDQVRRELNDAAVRERTQTWREEKSNVRDAVTDEIDKRPEYAAIRSLRRGKLDIGTDLTLNRDELVKQFGEERVKALQQLHRGLYRMEGGTDAETASELLGFGSGEEMMRALENAPRRAQAIEAAVRDFMTAKHGDIRYDGSLDSKAQLALENDERGKNLHKEVAALKAKVAVLEKKAADTKAAMASITMEPLEHYQEAARRIIQDKAPADLQPYRYLNAMRKFSREAFDALRKGNVKAAADAKNKELLNHFLFREASAEREYVDKFETMTKKVQSRGIQQRLGLAQQSSGVDYRDQFNWLLARYKAGPAVQAPERSLRAWAEDVYGPGNEPAIAPGILNEGKFADYRNVPLSEVHELHDALINIRHLAQREFKMFVQGKQIVFAEAKQRMVASARENLKSKPEKIFEENRTLDEKIASGAQHADALLMRMERIFEWLDGGKTGSWHDNIWNRAADAQGDEYDLQQKVTKVVTDALADMPAEMRKRLWTEKVNVDGISEPLTRRRMLSIAFNMGNEGNLDRLNKTFDALGWDRDAISKIGGMLTRAEWNFVQKAWDSLRPMGERMQELEKRLTGLPPEMVKVTPFKVALDDGTEMDLAGGYFPIKMDPRYSEKGIQQDAKETAQNAMQSGYVRASTSKGYTKARSGFGGPLLLDYEQVMTSHVAQVAKDLSHREFMLSTQRLLLDTEVRKTLRETLGPAYEKQMMPWLRTIINDRNGSSAQGVETLSHAMQTLRGNIVAAEVGLKFSTALLQITHAPRMLLYAKPGSIAQSLVDFLARPIEMTRENRELSRNEMRFRGDNLDRDIRAVLQAPDYKSTYSRKAAEVGRWTLQNIDHLFSHTLWRAAYRDGLEKYAELPEADAQQKAIYDADSAVRLGLGTQAPKDLPAIMRNNDFNKMITTLYGFHNGVYNQIRDNAHQFSYGGGAMKLTYATILTAIVPALLGSLVTGNGPKNDESAGLWAAKRSLLFSADTIPVLGTIAEYMGSGRDMQFSPIESVFQQGAKAAMETVADKDEKDWTGIGLDVAGSAGAMFGVPGSQQAVKTAKYVRRANQGKVENPNVWNALAGGGYR